MTWFLTILAAVIVLFLFFILSVKPAKRRGGFPYSDAMIAHRGLHNGKDIPENSIAAFKAAVDKGGLGVELDVQLLKDGNIVVFHDSSLKRVCGEDLQLINHTFEELSQYRLLDTDEKIPLFTDVLKALDRVPLVCEIKVSKGANISVLCEAAYNELRTYPGPWCIESFHPLAVLWFKKHHPDVIRGQLSRDFIKDPSGLPFYQRVIMSNLMTNFITKPDFIAYSYTDTGVLGYKLCASLFNPHTVAWTPRSTEAVYTAKSCGFEAVIFEEEQK